MELFDAEAEVLATFETQGYEGEPSRVVAIWVAALTRAYEAGIVANSPEDLAELLARVAEAGEKRGATAERERVRPVVDAAIDAVRADEEEETEEALNILDTELRRVGAVLGGSHTAEEASETNARMRASIARRRSTERAIE